MKKTGVRKGFTNCQEGKKTLNEAVKLLKNWENEVFNKDYNRKGIIAEGFKGHGY